MLRDWHQFDMGEPLIFDVGNQTIGEFGIGEQSSAWLQISRRYRWAWRSIGFDEWIFCCSVNPAAEVHLVNRDRLVERIAMISAADPLVVIPLESVEMTND